jgi:hypothetical protein
MLDLEYSIRALPVIDWLICTAKPVLVQIPFPDPLIALNCALLACWLALLFVGHHRLGRGRRRRKSSKKRQSSSSDKPADGFINEEDDEEEEEYFACFGEKDRLLVSSSIIIKLLLN